MRGHPGRVTERVTSNGEQIKLEWGGFNPYYTARSIDGTIEEGKEVMMVDPDGGSVRSCGVSEDEIDRALRRTEPGPTATANANTTVNRSTSGSTLSQRPGEPFSQQPSNGRI